MTTLFMLIGPGAFVLTPFAPVVMLVIGL